MRYRANTFSPTARPAVLAVVVSLVTLVLPVERASATTGFGDRMLELVNRARAAQGVGPVLASPSLASVAGDAPYAGCGYPVAGRSKDMGVRNYFSHTIRDCGGRGMTSMLTAAGVTYREAAENIAWVSGMTDPLMAAERLHNDLMGSPQHRANILNPAFTHLGVGSWHTAPGESWSGGGAALRNVYLTTAIFAHLPSAPPPAGGGYHPLTPARILDTRFGEGPLGPGETMDVQITGQGGVPGAGVAAVVLNMVVAGASAPSYLTVFPAGEAMPTASNLNYTAGATVANLVTAKLGDDGRLSVFNAAGSTDVIADVEGWYDDGTVAAGARYHPLTPSRILDTRFGAGPLGAAATLELQVTGQGGVPSTGVSAVILNVAVTGATLASYLTAFPTGELLPLTSNLNFGPGQTVPNLVTAKLGDGGRLSLFNAAGSTHVIADVAGWYDDGTSTTGGRYHPVTPSRILDTRFGPGPLGPAATMGVQLAGQGGVPATGASAVVLNVAVTGPTAPSYLTVFPGGEAMPVASNLNFAAGETVPNLVVAKLGAGGALSTYNAAGTTHVIADVAGWFDAG